MKKASAIALRVLISGGLLWLLFRQHSLASNIVPHLRSMIERWPWTLAGLLSAGLGMTLSAWRWWLVLRLHVQEVTFAFAVRATMVGWFFNITSLGTLGGDASRVMSVRERHPGKGTAGGVSVLVDHAAGMLGMCVLFFIVSALALFYWPKDAVQVHSVIRASAIAMFFAALFMVGTLVSFSPWFISRFHRHTPGPLVHFVDRMAAQFAPMWESVSTLLGAIGLSVVMLFLHFFAFYCGLRAVGGDAPLLPVLLAMPVVDMAAALPLSVSGLGVREKAFETLMTAFTGMPGSLSVSASLAGWLFSVAWGLVGGLVFVLGKSKQPSPVLAAPLQPK